MEHPSHRLSGVDLDPVRRYDERRHPLSAADVARDDAIGRRLTEVTLGIDHLERRSSGGNGALDSEGLVAIYIGEGLVDAAHFDDWESAGAALDDLERRIADVPAGSRATFLAAMMRSLRAAVQLFSGHTLTFAAKLRDLIGVHAGPVDTGVVEAARESLDQLLLRSGYRVGTLADRVRRWQDETSVGRDSLVTVFAELMTTAKARTDERVYPTGDFWMDLHPVAGVPFTARCGFNERRMDINLDVAFTRAALKHLVCHEVFPGHATQLLYTHAKAASGEAPADVLLCTANAVTGCVQEGIGDQGIELIDWIEDDDDAAYAELRRLQSAAATNAAWYLMGEGQSRERVADYLRDVAFTQDAAIAGRLDMAEHPFRGPFIASYWFGNEAVRTVRERTEPHAVDAFIAYLYGGLHSPASLAMFAP